MPRSRAGPVDALVVEPDRAFGRFDQAGDQAEQAGLAAAGRPDDDGELVILDVERNRSPARSPTARPEV